MERKITTLIAVEDKVIEVATYDKHPFHCIVDISKENEQLAEFSMSKQEVRALIDCLIVSLNYGT